MIDRQSIALFERYRDAPAYAFGSKNKESIVPAEDKDAYWTIFEELVASCEKAVDRLGLGDRLFVKPRSSYSRQKGARGHRPKDLRCAVRNLGSSAFNEMPQIYIIASDRGIEIGFAVSIAESDYHDQDVKHQNREIIPQIHRKLPVSGPAVDQLDAVIASSPDWHVNSKNKADSRGSRI